MLPSYSSDICGTIFFKKVFRANSTNQLIPPTVYSAAACLDIFVDCLFRLREDNITTAATPPSISPAPRSHTHTRKMVLVLRIFSIYNSICDANEKHLSHGVHSQTDQLFAYYERQRNMYIDNNK
jgi:hypothetical protein